MSRYLLSLYFFKRIAANDDLIENESPFLNCHCDRLKKAESFYRTAVTISTPTDIGTKTMRVLFLLVTLLLINGPVLAGQSPFDPISMEPERNIELPPGIAELTFESQGHRLTGLIYMANRTGHRSQA